MFQQLGNHTERKRLLIRTLELERKQGEEVQVAETLRQLASANWSLDLISLAWLYLDDKQLDAAEDTASHEVNLSRERGCGFIVPELHRVLVRTYRTKGEKEKAIHHSQIALKIARTNSDKDLFWNHINLAELFCDEDKFGDANAHAEQAKSSIVHDTYRLGYGMRLQADIWYRQGRFEEAKSEVLHALEAYEQLGVADEAEDCKDLLQKIEPAMESRSARP